MTLIAQVTHLFRRELLLEQRQKYAFGGVLLYLFSTIFICNLSFKQLEAPLTWNVLFWIILLFASVNAVAKSFLQESRGRLLYLYTLCDPRALVLAKMLYNALLMLCLGLAGLGLYSLLVGNPVQNLPLFFITLALGCIALASVFTMISAIASKAGNNFTLMAVLGFPIVLPLLMTILHLSQNAVDGLAWSVSIKYLLSLLSLNVIVVVLSYFLFPYLWRD